jgi:hypothetical protein
MKKHQVLFRGTSLFIAGAVLFCTTSCGTIMYPERRGQPAGQIDVGVAVLDGIGLLCFLVPGVVAFAVDFATGAIYLPYGYSDLDLSPTDLKNAEVVHVEPSSLDRSEIESIVKEKTGKDVELASPETKVAKVAPGDTLAWTGIAEVLTPQQLARFENN